MSCNGLVKVPEVQTNKNQKMIGLIPNKYFYRLSLSCVCSFFSANITAYRTNLQGPTDKAHCRQRIINMHNTLIYFSFQDRESTSQKILQETSNSYLIPPFDHPHIIAGQGSLGLELLEQVCLV